jgi:outer membrane protein TolC
LAQVQSARAAYEATVGTYRATVLTAFEEAEDYLSSTRILQEESAALDTAVSASQLSVALTLDRYKQGIASAIDVINTSTILLANRKAAIGILGNRLSASMLLIKALGGGWDSR